MSGLVKRDSLYRDLFDFRRDFDHIFNRFLGAWPDQPATNTSLSDMPLVPAVNAYVDPKERKFHCQVALPGIDPKDIKIQVQGGNLTISGRRETRNESKEIDVVYREWMFDSFRREIELPETVENDKISADYRNGTLEIIAPLSAASLPRRIEIKSSPEPKQIATAGR